MNPVCQDQKKSSFPSTIPNVAVNPSGFLEFFPFVPMKLEMVSVAMCVLEGD
jgi:hypothetical protein